MKKQTIRENEAAAVAREEERFAVSTLRDSAAAVRVSEYGLTWVQSIRGDERGRIEKMRAMVRKLSGEMDATADRLEKRFAKEAARRNG